nr:hypothetical protein [Tanacetum cinerariifolium]
MCQPYEIPTPSARVKRIRENLSTTSVNLPVEDDHSPLLAYIVWIFLAYLTYPAFPPYLYSFGNEDTIFDPGIAINRFYSFKPCLSHRCGTFKEFNTHHSHLNESLMEISVSAALARSVPAALSRSVPAVLARSVPAVLARSVPVVLARSIPAALSRSVPVVLARSVLAVLARSVPAVLARSVPAALSRSVPIKF